MRDGFSTYGAAEVRQPENPSALLSANETTKLNKNLLNLVSMKTTIIFNQGGKEKMRSSRCEPAKNYGSSFLLIFLLAVSIAGYAQSPPVITSFSPTSAKPGDAVTLTGTDFNTTTTNNIVFFGATRATVTAATATSLTATVPTGATYAPITLLNTGTGLAAASLSHFNPVYSPVKPSLTTADLSAKMDFTTGTQPGTVAIGDLDSDGKPDLSVSNETTNNISVFRNTSTSGPSGYGTRAMASINPHSTVRRRILVRPLHAHARLACSGIMRCR